MARQTDRLAYAFLPGTADVGAVEQKLRTLGVARERSSVGELLILHDLRLSGLDAAPPGLLFEALERLPLLDARLRIAAAYEAAGHADRAISHLEAALEPGIPARSAGVDRLLALYRATGQPAKAGALAARRAEAFTPAQHREASFGETVRLLGYTLSRPTVRAGDRLQLICFWSTPRPLDVDLHLTVQLNDGMRHQPWSSGPLTGAYGTTSWQPDEVVLGPHEIAIPRDFPPGRYTLRIRLWDPRGTEPALRPRAEGHGTRSRWLTLAEIEVQPASP
jgi:hypothetical protein